MRSAGILLPITALPSPYGVGTLGKAAREFVDFLELSNQSYWQLLPIGPTGFGDSPYQSFSTFAGSPYLIDLDELAEAGLLSKQELVALEVEDKTRVDYEHLYLTRFDVLRRAVRRLLEAEASRVSQFCETEKAWLDDYALFMSLKDAHHGLPWNKWEPELVMRKPEALARARKQYADDVSFWQGVQYLFYTQMAALKAYAHEHHVEIIGDLPIYVACDSVDTWSNPQEFQLNEKHEPIEVAGCPPDGFSATGQLWGNPLFDWDRMAKDDFSWWHERIRAQFRFFDVLRIDHFRGFDTYYAIPYGAPDACQGRWRKGPGIAFFKSLNKALGTRPIIAEDLGYLTPSVIKLLKDSGYPGMKVLEFGFDSRDSGGRTYQPHNYPANSIAYVGTHDNSTAIGWFGEVSKEDQAYAMDYLNIHDGDSLAWGMIRAIWQSPADTAIAQMQDVLELDDSARMNIPSTLGGNWSWRMKSSDLSKATALRLAKLTRLYERLPYYIVRAEEAAAKLKAAQEAEAKKTKDATGAKAAKAKPSVTLSSPAASTTKAQKNTQTSCSGHTSDTPVSKSK